MSNRLWRILLARLLAIVVATAAEELIKLRGYYSTFCRMPAFGSAEWKQIYDRIQSDGGNTVLLWSAADSVPGSFRSPGSTTETTKTSKPIS